MVKVLGGIWGLSSESSDAPGLTMVVWGLGAWGLGGLGFRVRDLGIN